MYESVKRSYFHEDIGEYSAYDVLLVSEKGEIICRAEDVTTENQIADCLVHLFNACKLKHWEFTSAIQSAMAFI